MSDDMFDKIETFTPQELAKVQKLIAKLAAKHETDPAPPQNDPKPTKIKGARKSSGIKRLPSGGGVDHQRGRKRGKGQKARPIQIDRSNHHNKFLEMSERRLHKQDSEIDKKLWGNNKPVPRLGRTSLVEIDCYECGEPQIVSPGLVFKDPERGFIYRCNDCSLSKSDGERQDRE
jgi:hypothetical protein